MANELKNVGLAFDPDKDNYKIDTENNSIRVSLKTLPECNLRKLFSPISDAYKDDIFDKDIQNGDYELYATYFNKKGSFGTLLLEATFGADEVTHSQPNDWSMFLDTDFNKETFWSIYRGINDTFREHIGRAMYAMIRDTKDGKVIEPDFEPQFDENGMLKNADSYYEMILADAIENHTFTLHKSISEGYLAKALAPDTIANKSPENRLKFENKDFHRYDMQKPNNDLDIEAASRVFYNESMLTPEEAKVGIELGLVIDRIDKDIDQTAYEEEPGNWDGIPANPMFQIKSVDEINPDDKLRLDEGYDNWEIINSSLKYYAENGSKLEQMDKVNSIPDMSVSIAEATQWLKGMENKWEPDYSHFQNLGFADKIQVLADNVDTLDELGYNVVEAVGKIDMLIENYKGSIGLSSEELFGNNYEDMKRLSKYGAVYNALDSVSRGLINQPFVDNPDFETAMKIASEQLNTDLEMGKDVSIGDKWEKNVESDLKEPMVYETPYENYDVNICVGKYADNGCLAIQLEDAQDGSPVDTISVNLMVPALNGYIYINNEYGQAQSAIDFIEKYGLGEDTGRAEQQGICSFPLVKIDLEKLLEVASNDEAKEILEPMIQLEQEMGEVTR